MRTPISTAVLVVVFVLSCVGSGAATDEAVPGAAQAEPETQANADWVAELVGPLEARLVSCCTFFPDAAQEGKVQKRMTLDFTVLEDGSVKPGMLVNVTYPGGIRVDPCMDDTLQGLKFKATGTKSKHVFRFDITPEIESAANVLRPTAPVKAEK